MDLAADEAAVGPEAEVAAGDLGAAAVPADLMEAAVVVLDIQMAVGPRAATAAQEMTAAVTITAQAMARGTTTVTTGGMLVVTSTAHATLFEVARHCL